MYVCMYGMVWERGVLYGGGEVEGYRRKGTLPYMVGRGIVRKVQQERYNKKRYPRLSPVLIFTVIQHSLLHAQGGNTTGKEREKEEHVTTEEIDTDHLGKCSSSSTPHPTSSHLLFKYPLPHIFGLLATLSNCAICNLCPATLTSSSSDLPNLFSHIACSATQHSSYSPFSNASVRLSTKGTI
jgi:hypothetical protein